MKEMQKTGRLVMGALLMCMIIVITMLLKIPIPLTQGYIHLGDAAVFMAILILGWKDGAVCAGIGSAMADIFCGMVIWAPWTLVIKTLMAVIMGLILEKSGGCVSKKREIIAMTLAGLWMAAGYCVAEWIIYGNFAVAMLGIPWNIGQFAAGMVIATTLSVYLCRTPARHSFKYRLKRTEAH